MSKRRKVLLILAGITVFLLGVWIVDNSFTGPRLGNEAEVTSVEGNTITVTWHRYSHRMDDLGNTYYRTFDLPVGHPGYSLGEKIRVYHDWDGSFLKLPDGEIRATTATSE